MTAVPVALSVITTIEGVTSSMSTANSVNLAATTVSTTPPLLTATGGLTAADGTNGQYFQNDGHTILLVTTTAGDTAVLTVVGQAASDFGPTFSRTYTLVAAKTYVLGPYSTRHYNDTNGNCQLTWSGTVTGTSVCPITVGNPTG
jgi:hypothetical protein